MSPTLVSVSSSFFPKKRKPTMVAPTCNAANKKRRASLMALAGIAAIWWYSLVLFVSNQLDEREANNMLRRTSSTSTDASSWLLQPDDSIYSRENWDGAPIVLEEYKLIFFTSAKVGCTVWKQLFRRIAGLKDWKAEATDKLLPWNPELNGLKYLYDYNRETASHMMTSPEYTRAIFVREPKERFLSAYLDKAVTNSNFIRQKCCPTFGNCTETAKASLSSFFGLTQWCMNDHWKPQSRRMDPKFWSTINFVGHMDTVATDAERLLRQVGAWDKYGKTGWGIDGSLSIFTTKAGGSGRAHATNAKDRLRLYYTPELERQVEAYYESDYANPVLNLTMVRIYTDTEEISALRA